MEETKLTQIRENCGRTIKGLFSSRLGLLFLSTILYYFYLVSDEQDKFHLIEPKQSEIYVKIALDFIPNVVLQLSQKIAPGVSAGSTLLLAIFILLFATLIIVTGFEGFHRLCQKYCGSFYDPIMGSILEIIIFDIVVSTK